ncbi:MAG: hypothetical protein ACSLEY_00615, partial [Candidatus Saccharimonadales bacterium]
MKKTTATACTIISFIIILLSFHIDETILRFLITGQIPGTTYALPALGMMVLYGVGFLTITTKLYQTFVNKLLK